MITLQRLEEIVKGATALMATDDWTVHSKGGYANIVTSADIAVQEHLREHLSAALPGSGFICEEEDTHDDHHDSVWIIDPIDGTANFARGIAECGISVGLRQGGAMRMGVVWLPRANELYSAEAGKGSSLNGKPIHVSQRPFGDCVLCTALPTYRKWHADVDARIILEAFKQCNDIRRFGSAATELCYLAAGRIDLYYEWQLSPWDFAASMLIIQEAGGLVACLDGTPPDPTRPSAVIGANSRPNLDRLLEIIDEQLKG